MSESSIVESLGDHLTVSEAAQFLGVSPWTLRNWDRLGKLKPLRHPLNGYRLYRQPDLESLLRCDDLLGKRKGTLTPTFDWNEIGQAEHFVQFYESDPYLVESVSGFVAKGLIADEGIVVIATQAHCDRIQDKLERRGLDFAGAVNRGQCIWLDAAATLAQFMVDGSPSPDRFFEVIGGVLKQAAQSRHRVRAFGEMVALLWKEGNRAAAKRLEDLWNELGKTQRFALYCAYPIDVFDSETDSEPFEEVCCCHSRVIPAESYASLSKSDEQLREITALQQRARALEAEVARRREAERELAEFLENAPEALHTVGPDGTILWANSAEFELLGYPEHEYIGRHISEFHIDQETIDDILRQLRSGAPIREHEARLRCKDGSIRCVLINSNVLWEDGQFIRTRCFTRDITARKRAEQRLQIQNTVAHALADAATLIEVAPRILQAICQHLGWQVGLLWYVDDPRNVLCCADIFSSPSKEFPRFEASSRQRTFERGIGLPGRIWASCKAAWIPNLSEDGNFLRAGVATAEGLHAAFGLPILVNGEAHGVMEFFSNDIRQPDEELLQTMMAVGNQIGQFIERRRAEYALHDSEQRLAEEVKALNKLHELSANLSTPSSFTEALDEVVRASAEISGTTMGLLQLWNPSARALEVVAHLGLPSEFLDLFRIVRPEDVTACSMAMRARKPFMVEDVRTDPVFQRYRDVAAAAGFCAVHSTPLFSQAGDILGMLSLYFSEPRRPSERNQRILDLYSHHAASVIERVRAEEAKARLAAIVEFSDDAIISKNLSGVITSWNASAERLFGYTSTEAIGQPVTMLIPPDRVDEEPRILERIRRGEPTDHYETIRRRKDGTLLDISLTVSPVVDRSGQVIGASKIARDITKRKEIERALRQSEQRYRSLLGLLPAAVYTCEAPSGVISYYNEQAARLWGRAPKLDDTEERFCGSFKLWRPDGSLLPHDQTPMAIAMRENRSFRDEEVVIERPDGTRITVLVNIDPLLDAKDQPVGAINVFHDTTVLKAAEEELRNADRRKDEFLATLAHELRNPLAPLRNSLQILRMTGGADSATQQLHDMMDRQITHMVRLVDDLLELSRISRGAIELKRECVELATIIENAVETSKPMIEAACHRLDVSLPPEPIRVQGDVVRLSQVLTNLLNNAAKYTNQGGTITIAARQEGASAIVSVRDTGIGIPREMLSRVFDMFAQIRNPLRSTQEGLGIGLSLVRTIVSMHGGGVEAHSDGLGRGSEFAVRLPIAEQTGMPQPVDTRDDDRVAVAPTCRILVVDDNRDSARSLAMLLKLLGADVHVAHDGPSALEAFSICRPSVALLDIGMPGMDGYEVAERVRSDAHFRPVTLIALTGWGQDEDRRRSREAGFDHHLVKPVDFGALQALLASLNGQKAGAS